MSGMAKATLTNKGFDFTWHFSIYDAESGEEWRKLGDIKGSGSPDFIFSPDGERIIVMTPPKGENDDTARILFCDTDSEREFSMDWEEYANKIHLIAFSPDKKIGNDKLW